MTRHIAGAFFLLALLYGCSDDKAKHEAEEAKKQLAVEQEARKSSEEARKAAETRYEDLRREKAQSNHVHQIKEKQAQGKIGTLTLLSLSSVVALAIVVLLLARERWLRRVVNAALIWVIGEESSHDP